MLSHWDDVRNIKLLESFDPRERQLKDLAIAEPGVSTRAADAAATALKRGRCTRDFFVLRATAAAANRTLQRSENAPTTRVTVLDAIMSALSYLALGELAAPSFVRKLEAQLLSKFSQDYPLTAGAGGTGRMISEAIFQSLPTLIQSMIIRNGLGVPSCPA
jgi:hypothetical protein